MSSGVQDAVARAEASNILNADCQFTVPKSGDLVRGLIQDYCLAGALLTSKDSFFTVHEFQTLVRGGRLSTASAAGCSFT